MVASDVVRKVFLLVSHISWFAALLFPLRHFSLGRIGGGNVGTAANPSQGVRKGTQAISDAFTSTSNVMEGLPGVSAAPRFDSCQLSIISTDLQSIKFNYSGYSCFVYSGYLCFVYSRSVYKI